MAEILRPETAEQTADAVKWALAEETPVAVVGGDSKAALGRPSQAAHRLEIGGLSGIVMYEPEELVLTARAGTPLSEVEAAVAAEGQELAFEPPDFGPLLGGASGQQTIGGVLACNLAGPGRLKAGAARDHFLGVEAVSGRGEVFKSGGRVVKNVTGYDLCKLFAGSYGTLAVMTEVTVKVLPAPEKVRTILVYGLDDTAAAAVMSEAMQSPHEVSAAAHLPPSAAVRSSVSYVSGAGTAATALRVGGPEPSANHRCAALKEMFAGRGALEELHGENSALLWREVRDVAPLLPDGDSLLWRVSVPPMDGPRVVTELAGTGDVDAVYDWAGGLLWLAFSEDTGEASVAAVRAAIGPTGGHATLWRAPVSVRASVPVFQPQPEALAALSARVKESFDPKGILNPGRMYAGV
ncbi:MAG: glycolate oxidase subunit GlcE [Alphaproteobacteria bacterium]|nr:glycolate oxidase subunit GlcE [Alphaproteobacteria bacterium]